MTDPSEKVCRRCGCDGRCQVCPAGEDSDPCTNSWALYDKVTWGLSRAGYVIATHGPRAWVRAADGQDELVRLRDLRPARRKVSLEEVRFKAGGNTMWVEAGRLDKFTMGWEPTGRTREFEDLTEEA